MPAEPFLERLMNEYGDTILRTCYLYLRDYQLAEDAVQETFIKAMNSYGSFKHQSSEKTWLIRIAINCCKNIMRNRWFQIRQNHFEYHMEEADTNPIDQFIETDSVSAAIMKLNAKDREILVLYYYQDLSVREIAVVIGKTENAIIQRLNRARKRLKKNLVEVGYEKN
ncbi:MAG: sigma-70 family RNA polymerase sigma factor [Lachnospiraceae bacterium]|jgi:RNA polymerase sigma factor (sigma-70 family)|nr:sigma-70 family RNA polymerase sigma factor [Lachnospiraceae bacterium]